MEALRRLIRPEGPTGREIEQRLNQELREHDRLLKQAQRYADEQASENGNRSNGHSTEPR